MMNDNNDDNNDNDNDDNNDNNEILLCTQLVLLLYMLTIY